MVILTNAQCVDNSRECLSFCFFWYVVDTLSGLLAGDPWIILPYAAVVWITCLLQNSGIKKDF